MRQTRIWASPHRTSIPPKSRVAATQRVSDPLSSVFDFMSMMKWSHFRLIPAFHEQRRAHATHLYSESSLQNRVIAPLSSHYRFIGVCTVVDDE
jgi:hypothetical protein